MPMKKSYLSCLCLSRHPFFSSIFFQWFQRIVLLVLGFIVSIRFVHPSTYGTAYVSLDLLESFSVVMLREGFRRTALRMPESLGVDHPNYWRCWWNSAKNVCRVGRYVSCGFVFLLTLILNIKVITESRGQLGHHVFYLPCFFLATLLAALGTLSTIVVEEKVVLSLKMDHFCRVKASMWSNHLRKIGVVLLYCFLVWSFPQWKNELFIELGLLCYAFGQFVNGGVFFIYFYWTAPQLNDLCTQLPKEAWEEKDAQEGSKEFKDSNTILSRVGGKLLGPKSITEHRSLLILYCFNSLLKLVLNEAERIILLMLFPISSWVTYGLASRLGGIVSRYVFSPIEEAVSVKCAGSPRDSLVCISQDIVFYMTIQCMVGWCALCFGPPLSTSFVTLVLGPQWLSLGAHLVLSAYFYYLFFLALNGVLEALLYAKGSERSLQNLNKLFPAISLFGLVSTMVIKKYDVTVLKHLYQNDYPASLIDVCYIKSLIKGSTVAVLLRLSLSSHFFLSHCQVKDFEKTSQNIIPKTGMPNMTWSQKIKHLTRILWTSIPFLMPCAVAGLIMRLLMYRENGLSEKILSLLLTHQHQENAAHQLNIALSTLKYDALYEIFLGLPLVGTALAVTFLVNKKYFWNQLDRVKKVQ